MTQFGPSIKPITFSTPSGCAMCYAKDTNKNLNHGLKKKRKKSIATVNQQMFRLNAFYYIFSKLYGNW